MYRVNPSSFRQELLLEESESANPDARDMSQIYGCLLTYLQTVYIQRGHEHTRTGNSLLSCAFFLLYTEAFARGGRVEWQEGSAGRLEQG